MDILTHVSLFAGIGGIDLGLRRALPELQTVCYVEIDSYCQRVITSRIADGSLDDAPLWDDITTFDGIEWRDKIDLLSGGFPCQDISIAGQGAGIDRGTRSGLWAEMFRLICEIRPRVVFVENVSGIFVRGLGRVLGDLASCGYDAEWDCVAASSIGANHRRERVFIVAYPPVEGERVINDNERFLTVDSSRTLEKWDTPSVGEHHPRALNRKGGYEANGQVHLQAQIHNRKKMYPTPRASESTESMETIEARRERTGKGMTNLTAEVKREIFPTPIGRDAITSGFDLERISENAEERQDSLTRYVSKWPTPRAADSIQTLGSSRCRLRRQEEGRRSDLLLQDIVVKRGMLPTPTASDAKTSDSDMMRFDSLAAKVHRDVGTGKLNADWVEWLMNFPLTWTRLEPLPQKSWETWLRSDHSWWEVEPNIPRLVEKDKNRADRLRALGNAVVPRVAEYVGMRIRRALGISSHEERIFIKEKGGHELWPTARASSLMARDSEKVRDTVRKRGYRSNLEEMVCMKEEKER